MEIMGVSPTSFDVRHESVPSMSTPKPLSPLKTTSSLPNFLSGPNVFANVAGPSRHMVRRLLMSGLRSCVTQPTHLTLKISSPLRAYSPLTSRVPPPPIDTSCTTPTRSGPQPLERVPTEPASAPPPRQQPTTDELAVLGIKVRDFAFEPNTLPRVPTIRRPFFRELKRQPQETSEDFEARKRNEARRLEFNTPRRRDEISKHLETLRFAFDSPRTKGTSSGGLTPSSRSGGAFANHIDLGILSTGSNWGSRSNVGAGPSPGGPRARLPLQRQPSEIYIPHARTGMSSMFPSMDLFISSQHARHGSTSSSSRLSNVNDSQVRKTFVSSQLPDSDWDWLTRSFSRGSQSQAQGSASQPAFIAHDSQDSQTGSEMDDEEYVKTPLVAPNGSLVFGDEFNLSNNATSADSDRSILTNDESSSERHPGPNIVQMDYSVINCSALPESQVAELFPVEIGGPDENVSASQMGLESQDLLSQPAWQQQSQSQALSWTQAQESGEQRDVEMPASQPEAEENRITDCDRTLTLTPTPSFARVSSIVVSPTRASASANSNHSATSSQPRPIPRFSPRSSPLRRSPSSRSLASAHSHSSLRRCPSLNSGSGLSRLPTLASFKTESSLSAVSTSLSSAGKARYNLRTPSPKKAKLLGVPSLISPSASRPRTRSRAHSAPASKRGTANVVRAAGARRTRSAAAQARSRVKGVRKGRAEDDDVVMAEEAKC
ncbi:hypothetical protein A7U60_g7667 [Sanghuangporus baumii]|uniref:Uncharacterized protein n=1 Tax=Sanghuangporus baumii TaxID=108892 RepID=A0A9Q5HSU2_SANBA|nr:hypothetical protein A7U60_g7667 [Sanghuangporus baumii]